MRATYDRFSGRVNPTRRLTEVEEREVQAMVNRLMPTKESMKHIQLGYRGMRLAWEIPGEAWHTLHVYDGVVLLKRDGKSDALLADDGRRLESYLLGMFGETLEVNP